MIVTTTNTIEVKADRQVSLVLNDESSDELENVTP